MNTTALFRRIIILLLIFHLLNFSQATAVFATSDVWKHLGPGGAKIFSLAVNPNQPATLYAGTNGGVIKTTNGGKDWHVVGQGIVPNANTWVVTLDPKTPSTVYAMSTSLFKSTDSGETWNPTSNGISGPGRCVVINPQTPDTLYAGTWEGVYKSINGGQNWIAANKGLTNAEHINYSYINALAIDPQDTDTLYAGTYDGGVFKSTDGGKNWEAYNVGLTASADLFIHALAIDPTSPGTLYAGTKGGLFKSTNHGANWIATTHGLPVDANILSLAIDPLTPGTLYTGTRDSGAFVSADGGDNWNALNNGLSDSIVNSLMINAETPSTLYAGTGQSGVFSLGGSLLKAKVYLPLLLR